jgi:hypothetical protein
MKFLAKWDMLHVDDPPGSLDHGELAPVYAVRLTGRE